MKAIEEENGIFFFQNVLKAEKIHQYSILTDKGGSICERDTETIRNFLKKPIFLAGSADWLSELPSTIRKYNITIYSSENDTHSSF